MSNPQFVTLEPKGRAVFDEKDRDLVENFTWRLDMNTPTRPRAYTYNNGKLLPEFPTRLYLERLLARAPKDRFVRFLNFNTLDCRKSNLEVVTWRRDTFLHDEHQRHEWELAEGIGGIHPDRRTVDVWRMWCQGFEPREIAKVIGVQLKAVVTDLHAMKEDPKLAPREGG